MISSIVQVLKAKFAQADLQFALRLIEALERWLAKILHELNLLRKSDDTWAQKVFLVRIMLLLNDIVLLTTPNNGCELAALIARRKREVVALTNVVRLFSHHQPVDNDVSKPLLLV
jgi:hypothetical protein